MPELAPEGDGRVVERMTTPPGKEDNSPDTNKGHPRACYVNLNVLSAHRIGSKAAPHSVSERTISEAMAMQPCGTREPVPHVLWGWLWPETWGGHGHQETEGAVAEACPSPLPRGSC